MNSGDAHTATFIQEILFISLIISNLNIIRLKCLTRS
jgi:hypothetical protein